MSKRVTIIPKGETIQRYRIEAGLSTLDFAEAAGMANSAVVRMEQNGGVRAKTAAAVCKALGKEFDDLFTIRRPGGVAVPAEREEVSA